MSEKRTQFFNELYTGERAEYKTTSVRIPAGLLEDLQALAEKSGRSQSAMLQEFIYKGVCAEYGKERGDLILVVTNPQTKKKPTEETRAEIMKILADVAALKIDKRAGFHTGINELINYIFEKLCKENTGNGFIDD